LYEVLVECYDVNGERKALSQTNSDGNFAFFLNARSTVELRVKENGYEDLVQQVPPFGPGESAREHVLRLVPK
ncbi:MAG: hypothetical protein KDB84_09895, partial [Flavobacteriales bacterium]|nr:hypothetical protein [Flavobacteriales bacterium]